MLGNCFKSYSALPTITVNPLAIQICTFSFESSIFPFILRGNALIGIDSVEIPLEQKSEILQKFSSDWKLDLSNLTKEVTLDGLEDEIQTILQGGQVGRIVVNLA